LVLAQLKCRHRGPARENGLFGNDPSDADPKIGDRSLDRRMPTFFSPELAWIGVGPPSKSIAVRSTLLPVAEAGKYTLPFACVLVATEFERKNPANDSQG
jgi:hypothetical protein